MAPYESFNSIADTIKVINSYQIRLWSVLSYRIFILNTIKIIITQKPTILKR